MFYTSDLLRWLQRKRYQYEVTFSLYMLTPTEKFIFSGCLCEVLLRRLHFLTLWFTDSFLFLFLSMIIIAASLYLPEHITTMLSRAWFYYAGDETAAIATSEGGANVGGAGSHNSGMKISDPGHPNQAGSRMPGQDVIDLLGTL